MPAGRIADILQTEFSVDAAQAEALVNEMSTTGLMASQLALQSGLLDNAQADVLATLERPNDVLPDYEFLGLLGRGAMGVVYRARQMSLDRLVAIKTIMLAQGRSQVSQNRFQQEGKTIARLRHPNIVGAYDLYERAGRMYLVMELLEGQPLDAWLEGKGSIDEFTAWWLIRQTAAALAHAAEHQIVHRDIKPSNLFVLPPPSGYPLPSGVPLVKLTDFGLAIFKQVSDLEATRLTQAGTTVGTPTYMAPEQIESSDVDHRADIYALGCTAFRLLSGKQPFTGTMLQVVNQKANHELSPLIEVDSRISSASSQLVSEMVRRDRTIRLDSYPKLLQQIDQVLATIEPGRSVSAAELSIKPMIRSNSIESASMLSDEPTVTFNALPSSQSQVVILRRKHILTISVSMLVIVGLTVFAFFGKTPSIQPFTQTAVMTANGAALFDGQEVTAWKSVARGSSVAIANDGEGGRVLELKGTVARRLPSYEYCAIEMHIDLRRAKSFSIVFGATPDGRQCVAKIERSQIHLLLRTNSTATFEVLSTRQWPQDLWEDSTVDTPRYVVVKIERQPAGWGVFVANELQGAVPHSGIQEANEFQLSVEGIAVIEEATISELKTPIAG